MQIIRKYYNYNLELRECLLFTGPVESYPGYVLREGMSGAHVKTLQAQLNRISGSYYIPPILPVDGIFGPATTESVKRFQQTFNLTPDGIVGKATWYKIQQIYAAVRALHEMESEGEYIGIGKVPPTSTIRQGARGELVSQLQFLLDFLAIFHPDIPLIVENGVFDARTTEAVKAFQRTHGLTADGIVGPGTWQALYQSYWGIVDSIPTPPTTPPTPPGPGGGTDTEIPPYPGYLLRVGSTGQNVMLIQTALNRLTQIYPSIPVLTPDGIFGAGTEAGVMAFQRLFGLTPDGIVGPATWNRLMTEYYKHLGTNNDVVYPGTPLRLGDRGEYVRLIQGYLNALRAWFPAIPSLSVDGIFGAGTQSAVMAFQRAVGLTPDGIVGPATWNALVKNYEEMMRTKNYTQPNTVPAPTNFDNPRPIEYIDGVGSNTGSGGNLSASKLTLPIILGLLYLFFKN